MKYSLGDRIPQLGANVTNFPGLPRGACHFLWNGGFYDILNFIRELPHLRHGAGPGKPPRRCLPPLQLPGAGLPPRRGRYHLTAPGTHPRHPGTPLPHLRVQKPVSDLQGPNHRKTAGAWGLGRRGRGEGLDVRGLREPFLSPSPITNPRTSRPGVISWDAQGRDGNQSKHLLGEAVGPCDLVHIGFPVQVGPLLRRHG